MWCGHCCELSCQDNHEQTRAKGKRHSCAFETYTHTHMRARARIHTQAAYTGRLLTSASRHLYVSMSELCVCVCVSPIHADV